jgi:hypothetical protein
MSQFTAPLDQSKSVHEVSESAFEFLLAEILSQPAYSTVDSANNSEEHVNRLETLGYDVGFR